MPSATKLRIPDIMVAVMKLKAMFHANSTSWNFEAKVTEADYLWRDDH